MWLPPGTMMLGSITYRYLSSWLNASSPGKPGLVSACLTTCRWPLGLTDRVATAPWPLVGPPAGGAGGGPDESVFVVTATLPSLVIISQQAARPPDEALLTKLTLPLFDTL